jgi:hypothetical protein
MSSTIIKISIGVLLMTLVGCKGDNESSDNSSVAADGVPTMGMVGGNSVTVTLYDQNGLAVKSATFPQLKAGSYNAQVLVNKQVGGQVKIQATLPDVKGLLVPPKNQGVGNLDGNNTDSNNAGGAIQNLDGNNTDSNSGNATMGVDENNLDGNNNPPVKK